MIEKVLKNPNMMDILGYQKIRNMINLTESGNFNIKLTIFGFALYVCLYTENRKY